MKNDKTTPTLRSLDMPRLVVELPDGKEVQHYLSGTEITIGRDTQNRIAIADNFISKFHAKLVLSKTSLVLVDLDSANKTYVNDQPISEAPVRVGDKIRFAAVKCRLEPPESQVNQAPARPATPPAKTPPPPAPPTPAPAAAQPAPPSARKPPAPQAPGASAPPPIEADPMKRLLRVGGLLILVSLALAIMLRVLLVPSEAPADAEAETTETPAANESAAGTGGATSSIPATTTLPAVSADADKDAEYYFDDGLAHLDTGRLREARESFEQALVLDPDHSRARTRLSLLEEEIEKKIEQHFDSARQAFQFLRYEEAIAEWEMFLLLADESDTRYVEAQQGIQQAQAKLR